MKKIEKYIKSNKGSITTVVLVTVLFFITILSTAYIVTATLRKSQLKSEVTAKEVYEHDFNNIDTIIEDLRNASYDPASEGVTIPTGFYYVGGTKDTGLVISDNSADKNKYHGQTTVGTELQGNQYVWVEVPQTVEVYSTAGLEVTQFTDTEYTQIENDLNTYTSVYRDLVWDWDGESSADYSDTYYEGIGLTSNEYNTLKKKMLKSIYKNGGFYVGRYETGIEEEYRDYEQSETEYPITETPVIKKNAYPYNYITTSQAQYLSERFTANSEGYTSSLMFGVQWDLVLKHLEVKGTPQAELNENSESWGNYWDNLYNITNSNSKYSTDRGKTWVKSAYGQKNERVGVFLTTGASDTFAKQNIYDLAGNVYEYTLENSSLLNPTVVRGGYAIPEYDDEDADGDWKANERWGTKAKITYWGFGFRVALYKDEGI